ncbi:MAG: winged helix-turn-helix transcriptional regulator [Microbacterium sp.]
MAAGRGAKRPASDVFAEVPPRVEYSLTPLGQTLSPVIDALRAWGE